MKKYDVESVFAAAIYGAIYPAILSNHLNQEGRPEEDLAKDLKATFKTALDEARYICQKHRAMGTKFGWHRK